MARQSIAKGNRVSPAIGSEAARFGCRRGRVNSGVRTHPSHVPGGLLWKKRYMVWLVTNHVMWLKEDGTHLAKIQDSKAVRAYQLLPSVKRQRSDRLCKSLRDANEQCMLKIWSAEIDADDHACRLAGRICQRLRPA